MDLGAKIERKALSKPMFQSCLCRQNCQKCLKKAYWSFKIVFANLNFNGNIFDLRIQWHIFQLFLILQQWNSNKYIQKYFYFASLFLKELWMFPKPPRLVKATGRQYSILYCKIYIYIYIYIYCIRIRTRQRIYGQI